MPMNEEQIAWLVNEKRIGDYFDAVLDAATSGHPASRGPLATLAYKWVRFEYDRSPKQFLVPAGDLGVLLTRVEFTRWKQKCLAEKEAK